jgi:putative addiction module component (TIGR02574 family)
MVASMKELGIDRLGPDQRIALAMEIWESLDGLQPSANLTDHQLEQLSKRDAELTANPEIALSWNQIRERLEAKH